MRWEGRPVDTGGPNSTGDAANAVSAASTVPAVDTPVQLRDRQRRQAQQQQRARRERCRASLRLTAQLGREPMPGPGSYGLGRVQLRREADRLLHTGWRTDEVRLVLTDPERVPQNGWCGP
jgi:hypothetical protein